MNRKCQCVHIFTKAVRRESRNAMLSEIPEHLVGAGDSLAPGRAPPGVDESSPGEDPDPATFTAQQAVGGALYLTDFLH